MFASVLAATFRILLFRAGPQDFPYDPRGRLTIGCLAFAIFANALLLSLLASPARALASSCLNVAMLALFTRLVLVMRKQDNRFQQTFNALLATTGALALLMLPFLAQIAPVGAEIMEQLQKNPELANHPEQLPVMPTFAATLFSLVYLWTLIVMLRIFQQAAGALAVLALLALALLMIMASVLSLGGGPA